MEMLSTQHTDNVLQHEIGGEPCTPPHSSSSAAAATATTTTMPNTMTAAVARFHDENQKRVPQAQAQRSTSMADAEDSPNSPPLMQHLMQAFSNDGVGWAGQPHPHVEEEKMLFAQQQDEQQQHLHEEAPIPIGVAAEELSDASSAASFDFIRNALTDIIHLQRQRVAAAASSNHNNNNSHGSSMPHHHPSQQQQQQPSHVVEPNETHLPQSRRAAPDVPSPISGGDVGGMHRRLPASWLPHCDVVVVAPTRAAGYRRGAEVMKAHEAQHEVHDDDDDEEEVEVIERYVRPFSPLFHASSHVGVASLDAHAHSTQPPLSTSCTPSSVSMPAQGAYDAYLAQLQHQQRQHKQVLQRQQLVGRGRDDDVVAGTGRRGVAQSSLHHTNNNNNSSTPTKNTTTRGIHVVSGGHRWRQSPVRADYHFSTTPSTSPSKSFGREMEDRSPIVAAAAMAAVAPPFHPPLHHHQHHHQEAYVVAEEIMIPHVSAPRGVMEVGHVGQHDGDDDAVVRRRGGVVAGAATPPPLPSSPHSDEGRNQSPVEAFADVLSTEKARFDSAAAFSTPMKPPLAVPTLQRTPMAAMVAKAAAAAAAAAAAGEGGRNNGSQQHHHHHQPVMTMLASRRKGCSVLSSPRSHSSALMGRGPHRRPPPATTKYLRRTNNMVVDADHNGDDDDDALPIFADSLVGAAIADLFPRIQRRQQHIHHACMEGTAPRTSSSSLASTPAAPSAAPSSSQQEALVYFYGRGYRLLSANH